MIPCFFSYFGAKSKIAHLYPRARYSTIIEPFAGGAAYSRRFPHRRVILVEKNPVITSIWKYLIKATNEEILSLPLDFVDLKEVLGLSKAQRALIGMRVSSATTAPCRRRTEQSSWDATGRSSIARHLSVIRHWKILRGDYTTAPDVEATWFVDPPYHSSGHHYKCSSKDIDYSKLGEWCMSRRGQVIVCEQEGADWLPFRPLLSFQRGGARGPAKATEVVWLSDGNYRKVPKGLGAL